MKKINHDAAEMIMKACKEQTDALLYNLRSDVIEQKKRIEKQRRYCPHIIWEQDMGFKIPYCRFTNQYCNGQCFDDTL